jgi:hypothetical protein
MLSIPGRPGRTCDGWSRRELLRVGGLSLLGLSLPDFLQMEAQASPAHGAPAKITPKAKQVVMIFLQGGPSHIDIWDPKPNAPTNIRGEFKAIPTSVDGIQVSETMPMMAKAMDKVTLVRSMHTPVGLQPHRRNVSDDDGPAPDKPHRRASSSRRRRATHMLPDGRMLPPRGSVRSSRCRVCSRIERDRQRRRCRLPRRDRPPLSGSEQRCEAR